MRRGVVVVVSLEGEGGGKTGEGGQGGVRLMEGEGREG